MAWLAAQQFESGGGFSPVTAMLGDADGPQAYLRQVGMGQALAQSGTEVLARIPARSSASTGCTNPAAIIGAVRPAG